ncbi:hypothetical protein CC117_08790 [Parafrankia colletiae]|uniref:Uncharacterized protein n=1 Tax=Parafrankia colletiae TaxID=573497 RepID=A0A1S1RM35_9ACTN|nr:hypothetical protein CC117_08790 [Parafrankia colletiae]
MLSGTDGDRSATQAATATSTSSADFGASSRISPVTDATLTGAARAGGTRRPPISAAGAATASRISASATGSGPTSSALMSAAGQVRPYTAPYTAPSASRTMPASGSAVLSRAGRPSGAPPDPRGSCPRISPYEAVRCAASYSGRPGHLDRGTAPSRPASRMLMAAGRMCPAGAGGLLGPCFQDLRPPSPSGSWLPGGACSSASCWAWPC